ncbi:hypothetical protein [Stutzerimonas balearica]|uniref:Uncharacterized protein n=1 Tax=Stutzerimonas balearica TaxID=74829 RepID=A0A9X7UY65_9GAMM|nr:hypothetical protein [Stutzerimonas balearica]QQN49105.1 hypothetical protein I6H70_11040 [Stutzerimonas balearica]
MPNFDQNFEATRLTMLAKQYPEIVKATGEVIFCAEDNEARLSGTRWKVEDSIFEQATESGFKVHLIELLDNFIEYRGRCNELPKKEGVVRFGDGSLNIEWLPDGSTELS